VSWQIVQGDALAVLKTLSSESVYTCITSPPYWGLRDYGVPGQIGLEPTFEEFLERLISVFREVRRVLRVDGTCWVNMGDCYLAQKGDGFNGQKRFDAKNLNISLPRPAWLKRKDLLGQPWRLAFALQDDGWYLRSDIIWHKLNPLPESVTDRPTKSHEYVFLLSKSEQYYYDADAIREPHQSTALPPGNKSRRYFDSDTNHLGHNKLRPDRAHAFHPRGKNKRTVWTIPVEPYPEAHFATFPTKLVEPCILAGCPVGGTVLDPFSGSGTTGVVALRHGRSFIGIELNAEYVAMSRRRIMGDSPLFNQENWDPSG
jgi:DNA modification methylase